MHLQKFFAHASTILIVLVASVTEWAQAIAPICAPKVTANVVVASAKQRYEAGQKAEPPVTDTTSGFAWPDTPIGVIKTGSGYEFFASDGGAHYRQLWQGHWVGNNKSGSVVTTEATLDNPLGSGDPQDVSISSNPDSALSGWGMIRRCWERLSMSTSRTCLRTVQGGQRLAALRELMPNLMA